MKLFSILTALLLAGASLHPKTVSAQKEYHVAVNGNDHNEGSRLHPFRTISAAANMAMPGDVITVHAGVYREQITPPRGGNSDRERITYQAAAGEKVIIKGSEIVKGWRRQGLDTWMVKIPNNFFGKFNPYKETIHGDWFSPTPKDRKYLLGAVYLNGDWLMEAAKQEEVINKAADAKNPLWCATTDADSTTIWAQFKNADPNKELVEINVRPTVFYPDKPFINFITVRGFTMEQAATNWAPPTAEQQGLIGTHWSRGWIIENNTILYSKCSGIALGKYGDEHDNNQTESAEGYVGTIKRALAFGWNKGTIGGHIVRNNTIAYCEQTGIVGSMGCSFSVVEGNVIHDIHIRNLFTGAEMAGIKFHGAIDVKISGNHIYRTTRGIWLDWMAQGAQVIGNLCHDNNENEDLFCEMQHGPILIANNIFLTTKSRSLLINSKGLAYVHNLIAGPVLEWFTDNRETPFHLAHSTYVAGLHGPEQGDQRFYNNLFTTNWNGDMLNPSQLPCFAAGNVYTKGAKPSKFDQHGLQKPDFDAQVGLVEKADGWYLTINEDKAWRSEQKHPLVTTRLLGKAKIPNCAYENADGSLLKIDTDYFGKKRDLANPFPGPFELIKDGAQEIKVWPRNK